MEQIIVARILYLKRTNRFKAKANKLMLAFKLYKYNIAFDVVSLLGIL